MINTVSQSCEKKSAWLQFLLLPPAYKVRWEVMFSQACVCQQVGQESECYCQITQEDFLVNFININLQLANQVKASLLRK